MPQRISSFALILAIACTPAVARAQDTAHREGTPAMHQIPTALKAEHEKLHADLSAATQLPGKTGEAAKRVAAVLHEHFVSEEEFALPPLALLAPIAEGRATADMRSMVALTDRLKAEMPRMLREHGAIVRALDELGRAAAAERHPEVSRFVAELQAHAQNEEQVLYPAAIVVGEYLKLKFPAGR
jgi:hemerythrin HHE cation binding domain-containing protein